MKGRIGYRKGGKQGLSLLLAEGSLGAEENCLCRPNLEALRFTSFAGGLKGDLR